MTTHTTTCSDCLIDLRVDEKAGEVSAKVPSNGLRGSKRIEAREVEAPMWEEEGIFYWDCPACGYADSLDLLA